MKPSQIVTISMGGSIANNTRKDLENKLGKKVISNKNNLLDINNK